ncbi:MAG: RDD family protein [Chloroflexi bacterium]|nr:RDD family protein [Chloroflexota bacterium]MCI0856871.1 RDD family protein [Chloroflexota bacterium]MCI0890199.1 RDD family protein [Chloroflexota bacterium]
MASPSSPTRPAATLGARIAAYLIDTIVLLAVLLIFFVIGGAVLLFTSDLGDKDPPDAAFNTFIAILIGGPVLFWSLLNLALTRWRAQTAGMYVAGIVTTSDEGDVRAPRRVLLRWFGMHPTLYHPLFVPLWVLLAAYATSATLSRGVLMVTIAPALLCLAVPIAGFVAMALDSERRGIHDRIARTRVVPVDAR